jgi:hypothetical protein
VVIPSSKDPPESQCVTYVGIFPARFSRCVASKMYRFAEIYYSGDFRQNCSRSDHDFPVTHPKQPSVPSIA